MSFLRQYVAPLLIVLIFLVAMVAVSARIFLPNDLAAPAPIEDPSAFNQHHDSVNLAMKATGEPATIIAQFYPVVSDTDTDAARNG